ncbi:uncharacterized protein B0J16DRAFT_331829 [Fusarium flagelliforme]|uniref:uncharacterized protein n=1 Tax=Fusarium flagelliforme TaxID=2675880 RepID=UPI001E8D7F44|nr:uncharacterized protein B0J16DRAFT_331829 [Fusarium flagelliforme]KAH7191836.1 hypothetical protein B0J16DRAFT_331829 [Fusarium flagelliforme]
MSTMKKTWFLPPDFTFSPDGPLQLGAVIPHPNRLTETLASPRTNAITLPAIEILVEKSHFHSNEMSRTAGMSLFAKFIEVASVSVGYERSRRDAIKYETVDHEVRSLQAPFNKDFLQSVLKVEEVKDHVDSGLYGKRPIYIVSGLRVTNDPFTVTIERGRGNNASVEASGPTGPLPVEVGGSLSGGNETTKTDSYETAPGIVFAYRLHVIRPRGSGSLGSEMFSHRKAFMSGEAEAESMEIMDVDKQILEDGGEEIEDLTNYEEADLDEETRCLWVTD